MDAERSVVVAKVGDSIKAKRSDSSGDMERFELMELVLMSEHESKDAAEAAAAVRRANDDGWSYSVLSRREYDEAMRQAAEKEVNRNA